MRLSECYSENLHIALVYLLSTLIADEVFNSLFYYIIQLLFVEHSDSLIVYCHGEGQFGLFNEEHTTAIEKRIHDEFHPKDRTLPTANALESLPF